MYIQVRMSIVTGMIGGTKLEARRRARQYRDKRFMQGFKNMGGRDGMTHVTTVSTLYHPPCQTALLTTYPFQKQAPRLFFG